MSDDHRDPATVLGRHPSWADVIGEEAAQGKLVSRRCSVIGAALTVAAMPVFWIGAASNSHRLMGIGGMLIVAFGVLGPVFAMRFYFKAHRLAADFLGLVGEERKCLPFDSPQRVLRWLGMRDVPGWPKVRVR